MQALEGIKVLDFCRNAPGMFCTTVLADLGAEVLMIERPMDEARSAYEKLVAGIEGEDDERRHAAFNALQRNKRSIALNLKESEAQQIFHKLAETADVVVEGFRPGVMDRLGAGYEKVRSINPRTVYCSVSGYGQDGPYSQMAGHDINYISFAGALGLIGERNGRPIIPLNLIADYAGGGLCGAVGILAALMAREKTGTGQYVDIAMSEGVLYMLSGLVSDVLSRGISAERGGNRLNGGAPYYNVYRTKDDKYFSIAAIEPWFWENLCRALDREDLLLHQEAQGTKKIEVEQALSEAFMTKTREEWFETLKDANISVGKVYSLQEALDDPHAQQRGMVLEIEAPGISEGKVRQVATSIHLSETPGHVGHLGSVTGQHTANILAELGFEAGAVADLVNRQVVQ
ncbi:MAG: CaiB/BaiF CoA-transferase family protein [Chloroflexota bacterium]|nr:CoA transferase [Dehalococcoidia bacterium]MEC9446367.1 CaiB/BaiF CoA-transferase family protein [Chloroflexota bacterium]MEE3249337.1 CaiB/BaiF CoA-transferase family protein [Chloroflexota bacterium]|tara:strand:+ start:2654 stop:3859 length:1206 start_codon:yes stop_codon:yes gene_type:complete